MELNYYELKKIILYSNFNQYQLHLIYCSILSIFQIKFLKIFKLSFLILHHGRSRKCTPSSHQRRCELRKRINCSSRNYASNFSLPLLVLLLLPISSKLHLVQEEWIRSLFPSPQVQRILILMSPMMVLLF